MGDYQEMLSLGVDFPLLYPHIHMSHTDDESQVFFWDR